ncbi:sialate O-acetylesterase [Pseudoflavonifractor sp. CLA-AP-H29]|uniref:Sialate O-acetylesterase n=1 Tax=Pseudoflavonifractor intestinihominis TaxID=3133171 RepID=A0ABV1E7M5_9FIRM
MKKRTCSLLLALAMILSFIPTYATAEDESGAGSPWDLLDADTEYYTDSFKTSLGSGDSGSVSQEAGYINILKGDDKSNTDAGSYTWVVNKESIDLPDTVFTVEASIRLSGPVEGDRTNEFSVRVNGTGKYFPIFLKYGTEDGGVTNRGDFTQVEPVDTTQWHNYGMVIDPATNHYKVYVDGQLVLEQDSNWGLTGADLIRLGADNKGRCNMDVQSVRAGTGDLSAQLGPYDGSAAENPRLTSVTLSEYSQTEGQEQQVTVAIAGENLENDTPVTVTLVDTDGGAVEGVDPAEGAVVDNAAEVTLTIPGTVPMGDYYVEAEAAGSKARSGVYQVTSALEAPDFPTFAAVGYTIEMTDYQYNPTEEFNFPTIVDTKEHPVSNSFGDNAYRYYLFYAPHDAPAGNCVAVSNSLDGPWIEYENNPVVGNKWDPYYSVSHVSSPQVMWIEEQGCYVMYFHGENPTTRYATSTDLLNWTYGGEIVHANDFSKTGSGFSEASYARVFEHTIPELGNKYIMLLMITGNGNNMHRNIYYAYSSDGIRWTPVKEPLLNPDELGPEYKDNFSGPWFMEWDGRYFVICHASSGEIYAFEVGESLDKCIEWGEVYNSQGVRNVDDANPDAYPDYGRAGAPYFIQDDEGRWHMFYEAGKRLNTNIVHAVEVRPGEEDQLARAGLTLDSETLTVGTAVEPELRVFNKSNAQVTEGLTCTYHVGGADPDCITYEDGVITAVSAGEATAWVEVTAEDGSKAVSDKIGITVKEKEELPQEVIVTNQMTPDKTALNLELPAIFKAEGVLEDPIDSYYLYFSYNDESGGTRSIALATAPAPEGPWTVYENGTPVMTAQSLGVASSVNAPWPVWDSENQRMLMYYSMGSTAIGVAESSDGVHFTNIQTVFEAASAPAGNQAYQQSVYEYTIEGQGNKYVMLYTGNGYRSEDGTYTNGKQIFYAVSDDGLNWTDSGKVLQFPDSGDKGNIASPRLLVRDGEPYVVYHNSNGNIGYSKLSADFSAASRQGIFYNSVDGEPDRARAADACFLQEGDSLYLYYTARSNKANNQDDASVLVCRKLAGEESDILFQDDFNDGDADGWTVDSGTWTVTDGAYVQSGAGGAMAFAGDDAWSNYELEVKVTSTETSKNIAVMVSGRADGTQNRYVGAYNGGKLMIDRRIDGGSVILAQKEYTMELGQTYTLKMTFSGDNIALYVNGVKELEAVDGTHSSGRIGLATYNTSASFDDVIVRAVDGAPQPSAGLTVEDFGDHQVIQRDVENENAVITVSGTVAAEGAAKVEARVMDYDAGQDAAAVVDWTEMASDFSAGTWSGSMTVPQGGWYRLEVRALDAGGAVVEEAAGTHKWGVGINILCIGQSNMVGQATETPRTQASDLVANYTRSGQWTHLVDPYDGAGGSMTPALGNYLVEALGIPVGFVPAADSGSGLHAPNVGHAATRYWMYYTSADDTSTLYGKAVTRAKAAGGVELMVWNQGETDGRLMIAEEVYEQDMKTLLQRFRDDLGDQTIPMFLCQIGTHNPNISNDAAYTAIRNAQHDLDDGENFFLAATEMEFARKDTAHYKKDGQDEIGRRVANSILYYYGESDYYRGPYISGAEYVDGDRSVIDVKITHRGGSDITPATGNIPGFTVLNGTEEVEVLSAVRQDADTIRLTLAEAIPEGGSGQVRYLYGLNPFVDEYDTSSTVSDLQANATVVKDNTPLQLPLENTTTPVLVEGDQAPAAGWDLMDHAMASDWTADGWRSSTKTGSITQQDEYVNISKPNESGIGTEKLYHWVISPATLALPRDGFTLQVEARVAGMVDNQANEIAVRMGTDANDTDGKIASIFLGYGEDGFVSTMSNGTGEYTMALDTTVWHTFSIVVRLDAGVYVFDLFVDDQLAFENVPLTTYKGGDLIRLGADNGGRCNLDVKHVRLGTGEVLPDGVSPARVTEVTLSGTSQKETESAVMDVSVTGTGFADGEQVTLTLVDKRHQAVDGVAPATASFIGDTASAQLTIPSGLAVNGYYVKAVANGRTRYSGVYNVEADRTAPVFPEFTAQGYTIELEDYIYNPTNEFNFPTIVDTKDHPVSNELGDYRYYLFYAPHDNPAGNCVAVSNSLDGPWIEYDGNPVVSNQWDPYYDVSHVSSPYVMWLEEQGCYIMYFHGENPVTRYALSDDLLHWEYGGECLRATDFRSDGGEASYARVFEHTIPELGNKYIMLLMISPTGGFSDKNRDICWAYSDNGTDWTVVQEPLLDPTMNDEYQGNFSGPWFMPWEVDGETRYFVICHASSGNMYAFEVGESLNECIEWGVFYDSKDSADPDNPDDESAYPDYGRAGAPCFIQDDEGRWHMFYEGGKRLHANIVHATAPAEEAPSEETADYMPPTASGSVETLPDGSKLVTQRDLITGDVTETLTRPDGVTAQTTVTEAGEAQSRITIPAGVDGTVVEVPSGSGNVAVRVEEDGTETVLPIAYIQNGRARIWLEESAVIRFEQRAASFTDITDAEIKAAAEQMAAQGIFSGTGDQTFAPELPVDRATLVTVLYRLDGMEKADRPADFMDVEAGAWYADAVAWCQDSGVTNGVGGGRFAPDAALTWEQTAVMLYRYAGALGVVEPEDGTLTEREAALLWCAETGMGAAENPGRAVDRGQLALTIQRYIKALVG